MSRLCSERKQKEVGELLAKNNVDIVDGQESWGKDDTQLSVKSYKWFGKLRSIRIVREVREMYIF